MSSNSASKRKLRIESDNDDPTFGVGEISDTETERPSTPKADPFSRPGIPPPSKTEKGIYNFMGIKVGDITLDDSEVEVKSSVGFIDPLEHKARKSWAVQVQEEEDALSDFEVTSETASDSGSIDAETSEDPPVVSPKGTRGTWILMPERWVKISMVTEVPDKGNATATHCRVRPGLFFDVADFSPAMLTIFQEKGWIMGDHKARLLPLTSVKNVADPVAVSSQISRDKAIKTYGVEFKEGSDDDIMKEHIATLRYKEATVYTAMALLPDNVRDANMKAVKTALVKAAALSSRSKLHASAAIKFLGKIAFLIQKGKLGNLRVIQSNYLLANCVTRRRGVTLAAYKKASEKMRKVYFEARADEFWEAYSQNAKDKAVASGSISSIFSQAKAAAVNAKRGAASYAAAAKGQTADFKTRLQQIGSVKEAMEFAKSTASQAKEKLSKREAWLGTHASAYKVFGFVSERPKKWYEYFWTIETVANSDWAEWIVRAKERIIPEDEQIPWYKRLYKTPALVLTSIALAPIGMAKGLWNLVSGQWDEI
ncbi:hypothetical protein QKP67_gp2 [Agaricus bisporus virus 11]|uniref:Uncharacterized protein n=1 Tax=Agaricus bisporus virus 11 TaxID=1945741 RepID=A0AAC9M6X5_9VIRU|nr:hypothetical protein QKP67_gp2 [Agaricus bisporus virus 11]AQM49939.1 hypothetical protein [Agaricus bisporus virus 11]